MCHCMDACFVNLLVLSRYNTPTVLYKHNCAELLTLCAWATVTVVCVYECYQATSYTICLNVKTNVPMKHGQCFLDF